MVIIKSYIVESNISNVYDFFSNAKTWEILVDHCKDIKYIQFKELSGQQYEKFYFTTSNTISTENICTERWKQKDKNIVYNQTQVPFGISHHSGEWNFESLGEKTRITSTHILNSDFLSVITKKYSVNSYEEAEKIIKDSIIKNSDRIVKACAEHLKR